MLDTLTLGRIVVEAVSAIICVILVKFMIKPYRLTGEGRYLGLPLGFGFIGISYVVAAVAYFEQPNLFRELLWLQLLTRTFAFAFLAATYYFSRKPYKNTRIFWNIIFSALIVALITSFLVIIISPQIVAPTYTAIQMYVRIFNILCLSYVAIHTLRSHVKKPEPTTIWIPLGFILLAVSQYSLLAWYLDSSYTAFIGALVLRLTALSVFLIVAYQTFYRSRKSTS
jgi:hypothetical protein